MEYKIFVNTEKKNVEICERWSGKVVSKYRNITQSSFDRLSRLVKSFWFPLNKSKNVSFYSYYIKE